jgi:hypothetical protein
LFGDDLIQNRLFGIPWNVFRFAAHARAERSIDSRSRSTVLRPLARAPHRIVRVFRNRADRFFHDLFALSIPSSLCVWSRTNFAAEQGRRERKSTLEVS